jgi:hypothetical protein
LTDQDGRAKTEQNTKPTEKHKIAKIPKIQDWPPLAHARMTYASFGSQDPSGKKPIGTMTNDDAFNETAMANAA